MDIFKLKIGEQLYFKNRCSVKVGIVKRINKNDVTILLNLRETDINDGYKNKLRTDFTIRACNDYYMLRLISKKEYDHLKNAIHVNKKFRDLIEEVTRIQMRNTSKDVTLTTDQKERIISIIEEKI